MIKKFTSKLKICEHHMTPKILIKPAPTSLYSAIEGFMVLKGPGKLVQL